MKLEKLKLIGYLLLSTLLGSKCKEEVKPLPYPPISGDTTPALDTLWTSPIGYGITPKINSNNDVLMSEAFISNQGEIFKLFDGNTGKLKWQWADYFKPEEGFFGEAHIAYEDVMILCARKRTYAFSMLTGQTIWRHDMDSLSGEPYFFMDADGYVYHGYYNTDVKDSYYIYRTKYNEGNWELVCKYNKTDTFNLTESMTSSGIGFAKNKSGEQVMLFDLSAKMSKDYYKRICGYNINTKKFEWIRNFGDSIGVIAASLVVGSKDKIFTISENKLLIAFDASSGNIVWKKELPEFGTSMFLDNDNVIVTSDFSDKTSEINIDSYGQDNGIVQWKSVIKDQNLSKFDFESQTTFKNYLFSTQCGNLLVINLDDGSIVFNKPVALRDGCLQEGIAINPQKRCFYVQDRQRAVCYKLPDEVKY